MSQFRKSIADNSLDNNLDRSTLDESHKAILIWNNKKNLNIT